MTSPRFPGKWGAPRLPRRRLRASAAAGRRAPARHRGRALRGVANHCGAANSRYSRRCSRRARSIARRRMVAKTSASGGGAWPWRRQLSWRFLQDIVRIGVAPRLVTANRKRRPLASGHARIQWGDGWSRNGYGFIVRKRRRPRFLSVVFQSGRRALARGPLKVGGLALECCPSDRPDELPLLTATSTHRDHRGRPSISQPKRIVIRFCICVFASSPRWSDRTTKSASLRRDGPTRRTRTARRASRHWCSPPRQTSGNPPAALDPVREEQFHDLPARNAVWNFRKIVAPHRLLRLIRARGLSRVLITH